MVKIRDVLDTFGAVANTFEGGLCANVGTWVQENRAVILGHFYGSFTVQVTVSYSS